jgi:hypothetical protein
MAMDRVRPLERAEVPPDAQAIYDRDKHLFGVVLNPTRIFAHRPPILTASKALSRSVAQDGVLSQALRCLVCVRVASLVGCPF